MRLLLVLGAFVAAGFAATWNCTFTDPDGYNYNFNSVNTNSSDKKYVLCSFPLFGFAVVWFSKRERDGGGV
jgi:hypothetical protein